MRLHEFKNVKTLAFDFSNLTEAMVEYLVSIKRQKELTIDFQHHNRLRVLDVGNLDLLKGVRSLKIKNIHLTDKTLISLTKMVNLRDIQMTRCSMSKAGFAFLYDNPRRKSHYNEFNQQPPAAGSNVAYKALVVTFRELSGSMIDEIQAYEKKVFEKPEKDTK